MYRVQALIVCLLAALVCFAAQARLPFSGASALEFTRKAVALGPRTVGSEAHRHLGALIVRNAKQFGCEVEEVVFTAQTPLGPRTMKNILAKRSGSSGKVVVLSGHYDTKVLPNFVGANDSGASTGILMELARVLCKVRGKNAVWIVWLDGEEALREWTSTDSLYGSRHLAQRWADDGTRTKIKALINLDMIGDRDLVLMKEWNSDQELRELVWRTAAELGHSKHFGTQPAAIEDDHIPFLRSGIPALDLIDLDYGPGNSYWHTERDTVDKLSADSFQVVGDVVLRVLQKLEDK